MEGIRLRSDSDGSVKNAFYQGTIVSDAIQGSPGNDRGGRKKNTPFNLSSTRSSSPYASGDYSRIPPLPRQSKSNRSTSSGSARGSTRTWTSPKSTSNEPEDAMFEFDPQASDSNARDSLRYSTPSVFSSAAQQHNFLLGTSLLGDSNSKLEHPPHDDSLPSSVNNRQVFEATVVTASGAYFEPSLLRDGAANSSFASTGSGIYCHYPAPPGPPSIGGYGSMQPRPLLSGPLLQFPMQQQTISAFKPLYGQDSHPLFKTPEPTIEEDDDEDSRASEDPIHISEQIMDWVDFSTWLTADFQLNDQGQPDRSIQWTFRGIIRHVFYHPIFPEFSTLQHSSWAVIIGAFMGVYTAGWKLLIEACVEFTWKTVPEKLLDWGILTELDGIFPLFHYMWIVPTTLGGVLSYIIVAMKTSIPTQDDWIHTLHSRGVEESDSFVPLFLVATAGMASGLSLGPELPLVLTAGMIGSWLAIFFRQSMIQARILNLTAASAAIGGFFGFPMAGALFVLELPHRMGLQYFEALNSSTIASIVAVLINRIVINNDVTGMFQYPFLNESLPSYIFKDAIVYGLFGGALGILYILCVKNLKNAVHHLLDGCDSPAISEPPIDLDTTGETTPLVGGVDDPDHSLAHKAQRQRKGLPLCGFFAGLIPHPPTRAAVTGMLAGLAVGVTGIFLPHVMFWGEGQLQTMIDKGRTPLPVFGQNGEPTAGLVALGQCMVDRSEDTGFGISCSLAIIVAKIFVTGVSLGTGIVGGHFWAPLFVGCVAAHLFTDVMQLITEHTGSSFSLAQYPCVALLCIMGSAHVVTFRAHIAIILILTLTIDAFVPEDSSLGQLKVAGDYSAVFPLLTVAVFVAMQVSRHVVFYKMQRSRGDINALPQALCEPGKEGKPLVIDYDGNQHELDEDVYAFDDTDSDEDGSDPFFNRIITNDVSQEDIEASFNAMSNQSPVPLPSKPILKMDSANGSIGRSSPSDPSPFAETLESLSNFGGRSKPATPDPKLRQKVDLNSLDELLNGPMPVSSSSSNNRKKKKMHRRTQSEPFLMDDSQQRSAILSTTSATPVRRPILKRLDSYGEIGQDNPSLMDQVRGRAASVDKRFSR